MSARTENLSPETEMDGRRLRSIRNRELVAQTTLELLREGYLDPSVDDIATRSGLSQRTVFRLFGDVEQLFSAAVAVQAERVGALLGSLQVSGSRKARVQRLVKARARLYEEVSPVRRFALRHAPFQPVIREGIDQLNAVLRGQLEELFEVEISSAPRSERHGLTDRLSVITSWSVWESLRTDQHLSIKASEAAVTRLLAATIVDVCGPEED
jgi:AcrR family transcriptional regulator